MDSGGENYRRFCSGDDSSMVELVREYSDHLILYLNNYVDDIHIAEDLMQETFIKIAVNKPRYDESKSSFKTWLYSIGRNIAIDYLRKNTKIIKISFDDHYEPEDTADIEKEILISERNAELYKALKNLKQEYRQVLYLSYFENFSNDESAKIMHKSKRQIENLLYNAKKALRSELERCGNIYEEL